MSEDPETYSHFEEAGEAHQAVDGNAAAADVAAVVVVAVAAVAQPAVSELPMRLVRIRSAGIAKRYGGHHPAMQRPRLHLPQMNQPQSPPEKQSVLAGFPETPLAKVKGW
eukprot:TRINITY_DN497_c2_g1_i1.p2 TRINITY_DN497_c2_g1~~TRINITY_DN497_c2_g1_i1.p2  ORF type:complete len:110 (-),score=20.05 TRINITY_DN497_c2_g1_i1:316-645(-)